MYRQAVTEALDETRGGLPATSTSYSRLQAAQKALDKLTAQGIMGYTDKAGRQWNLASYVEMATRTAVSQRYDDLQNAALERAGVDLIWTYTISTEGTCPECLPWLDRLLSLGGGTTGSVSVTDAGGGTVTHDVEGTLDEAKASGFRHPSCFPAGVMVSGPPVIAATSRRYEGDLVTVIFADGQEVPVTPNHPVLTPDGWMAAGDLREGHHVLRCFDAERVLSAIHPDDHQAVTSIENVAAALGEAFPVRAGRMEISAEDFHGDGSGDNEVQVVSAQRHAVRDILAEVSQHGSEFSLKRTARPAGFTDSDLPAFLCADHTAAGSVVGGIQHAAPLSVRGSLPSNVHSLAAVTTADPHLIEHSVDDLPVEAMPDGKGLNGLPAEEILSQVGGRGQPEILHRADAHPALSEHAHEDLIADAAHGRRLAERLSGFVSSDRVTEIRRVSNWFGHVYNLETVSGWYFANGLIAHNCRCEYVPYTDGTDFGLLTYAGNSPTEAAKAYEASQVQRGHERKVRAAASRAAVAITPEAKAKAKADLKAAKAASKAHRESAGVVMTNVAVQRRERTGQAR